MLYWIWGHRDEQGIYVERTLACEIVEQISPRASHQQKQVWRAPLLRIKSLEVPTAEDTH